MQGIVPLIALCIIASHDAATAATANPRHGPDLPLCQPPCCRLETKYAGTSKQRHVVRFSCWEEPVVCVFEYNFQCQNLGQGGPVGFAQYCGVEHVQFANQCQFQRYYENDAGCQAPSYNPCEGLTPVAPSPHTTRRCHDECLQVCASASLGCWVFSVNRGEAR